MTRRFLVTGRVQGVGFRQFVRSEARRMNLRGWVRNREDGRVETVVSAERDVLQLFELALRNGPPLSRVDSLDTEEIAEMMFDDFEVRF
jgi:acylphosphatase